MSYILNLTILFTLLVFLIYKSKKKTIINNNNYISLPENDSINNDYIIYQLKPLKCKYANKLNRRFVCDNTDIIFRDDEYNILPRLPYVYKRYKSNKLPYYKQFRI